jgi:hypothetical protein
MFMIRLTFIAFLCACSPVAQFLNRPSASEEARVDAEMRQSCHDSAATFKQQYCDRPPTPVPVDYVSLAKLARNSVMQACHDYREQVQRMDACIADLEAHE